MMFCKYLFDFFNENFTVFIRWTTTPPFISVRNPFPVNQPEVGCKSLEKTNPEREG
jgi:hypothetical protein